MRQNTVITTPLLNTWDYKQDAGDWDIQLASEFICCSKEQQKASYIKAVKMTLKTFSDFARAYQISIISVPDLKSQLDRVLIEWQPEEEYKQYIERTFVKIRNYPDKIYEIEIKVDLNVFIYTKESPYQPIREWVRCFDKSLDMGEFSIDIPIKDEAPSMRFYLEHTLFYPFSYQNNEDNTELFELNQPLLEKAFKSWENKFNSEIEAGGLTGVYKYGFLPREQW
ncbi:MAG: hypothetical protein AAFQ91_24505 [Cyanobacteria bacterium J06621_15]